MYLCVHNISFTLLLQFIPLIQQLNFTFCFFSINSVDIFAFFSVFVAEAMVSRRKILSRSRDDLNMEQPYVPEEEEDVWYQKDKLFKVSVCQLVYRLISVIDMCENEINHSKMNIQHKSIYSNLQYMELE